MKTPKSKDLKSLQKIWYAKLKKEGFEDVESVDGYLIRYDASIHGEHRPSYLMRESKEEYFRLAGQLLYEYPFESVNQLQVWTLHAEGLSIREVVKALRKKRIYMKRSSVHKTIRTIAQTIFDKVGTRK